MNKKIGKTLLFLVLITLIALLQKFGSADYLSLDYLKQNQYQLQEFIKDNFWMSTIVFFISYILITALSIPGAAILTLASGAFFGLVNGVLLVSFASSIGATLAMIIARYLLRDFVENKFEDKVKKINKGINEQGAFYLLSLRLIPIVPFFVINLAMGLTRMKVVTFYLISQVGMLLGTIVYVNAGSQLAKIESVKDVVSFEILASFTLLGVFPLLAKNVLNFIKNRKLYSKYKRPKKFDYNMIVIGAGSGGLVTAYIASAVKSRVALIEKNKMGGDCLNTGCVPSKALIQASKNVFTIKNASQYGITTKEVNVDFSKVMEYVKERIQLIEPHDSVQRYESLGVECFISNAQIVSPWEVKIKDKILTSKNITIATGAKPFIPQISGLENVEYLTSENLFELNELPNKLLILGAGAIGLEMAQAFSRLGSKITLIEQNKNILSRHDQVISDFIQSKLEDDGIQIKTGTSVIEFMAKEAKLSNGESISFDKVLIAIGRSPNSKGLGLEELGIKINDNGTIWTNEYLQATYPNIYTCGDVAGPYQLTHAASYQAWYCAVNALFGRFKKFKADYSVIPDTIFTTPEIASVGHNEKSAQKDSIDYELTTYDISDLDRAICDGKNSGMVRVLTRKGSDKIIGAQIVSENASDMLTEFTQAMKHNLGLEKILGTIHPYPTWSESNKFVAGQWKKNHTSDRVLSLLSVFHKWGRK